MPNRFIPYVKAIVHLLCLGPILYLAQMYRNGSLVAEADPVNFITHFTGNWALWMLLTSLAITPIRRLHPRLSNLVRFRRMIGLYAFFYATLHLATYIFLFSGYDVPTAIDGLRAGRLAEPYRQFRIILPRMVDDIEKRRFIQVGMLAWVILLTLALTSPAFIMRKIGGRSWQALHRLVYGAAICACVHYFWLVKPGVRTPWNDTVVLIILLAARVLYSALKRRKESAPSKMAVSVNQLDESHSS